MLAPSADIICSRPRYHKNIATNENLGNEFPLLASLAHMSHMQEKDDWQAAVTMQDMCLFVGILMYLAAFFIS